MDKHPESVPELLDSLRRLQHDDPKAVRSTVHLYPASLYAAAAGMDDAEASTSASAGTRRITSWKMTEHMYFKADNKFPTLARGLFTEDGDGNERIVARGYDKFFNTDETAWTEVSSSCEEVADPSMLIGGSGTACDITLLLRITSPSNQTAA